MTENNLNPEVQAPTPKKKSRKTPIIIAVAAVVVVAAVLIAVFAGGAAASPLALVAKGAENTVAAIEASSTVTLMEDLITHGSMDVTADLAPITESAMGYAMDGQAKVSVYYSNKESLALTADVTLGVTPLLDAMLILDPQDIAVGSQALLGDKVYGVDLETLPSTFDSSVFGPNGAYSLGMTAEEVMQIVDSLKAGEELPAEAEKVIKDFSVAVAVSLAENSTVSKDKYPSTFADVQCDVTAVTVNMDAEDLCNIIEDVLTYLDTNEELRSFLYDHAAEIEKALAAQGMSDGNGALDAFYAGVSEGLANMEEMRAKATENNAALTLAFHITDSGDYLAGTFVNFSSTEGSFHFGLVIGPDPHNPQEITIQAGSDSDNFAICYVATPHDKDSYSANLNISENDTHIISCHIDWDKTTGALRLQASAEDDSFSYSCSGTFTHSDEAETFTILSVSDGYEDIPLSVTITLNRTAQFPELPAYTDLLTMSQTEIDGLLDDLSAAAMGLLFAMG